MGYDYDAAMLTLAVVGVVLTLYHIYLTSRLK